MSIPSFEEYLADRGVPSDGAYSSTTDGNKTTIVSYPTDELQFDKDKFDLLMKSMKSKEQYEKLMKNRTIKQSYEEYAKTFETNAKQRASKNVGVETRLQKDRDLNVIRGNLYKQYLAEYPEAETVLCATDESGNRVEKSKWEYVPIGECKRRNDLNYRVEMNKTGIGKFTNFLTDVADTVVEFSSFLPGVGQVASEVYKNFAPPTSKFASDNLIRKFTGSGVYHRRKKIPKQYLSNLTKSQKGIQTDLINKSKEEYEKTGLVSDRPKVSDSVQKRSPYVVRFEKKYGFPITEIEKVKNLFSDSDIDTILSKGIGAYASSGSRPNVTATQWTYARLASVLTGGPALRIDKDLIGEKSMKIIKSALSGAGFFDSIFNKAKEYIAIAKQRVVDISRGVRRDNYPPNVRKLLESIGNDPIVEIYVRRDPIKSFLNTALNLITLGMWNKAREKYNYDKVFHLGLELTIKVSSNNDIVGRYVLEKNEVINLQPAKAVSNDTELIKVQMNGSMSLNDLLNKTNQRMGPNMFIYDAFTNNCQDFIANVLLANGLADPKVLSYVKQPLEKVLQSLPSYTKTIAKSATDIAALADVALKGRGSGFLNELQSLQISPQKYLKIARHFAKLHGYDPKNLQISDNPKKKLMYSVGDKKIHFGAVHYGDYILYSLLNPQIAEEKRSSYLSRAMKISGDWKKDPNSPNNLAIHILWSPKYDL
jgi:hypothetical protein